MTGWARTPAPLRPHIGMGGLEPPSAGAQGRSAGVQHFIPGGTATGGRTPICSLRGCRPSRLDDGGSSRGARADSRAPPCSRSPRAKPAITSGADVSSPQPGRSERKPDRFGLGDRQRRSRKVVAPPGAIVAAASEAAASESASPPTGAEVVSSQLLEQLLVAVHHADAGLDLLLAGEAAPALARSLERTAGRGSRRRSASCPPLGGLLAVVGVRAGNRADARARGRTSREPREPARVGLRGRVTGGTRTRTARPTTGAPPVELRPRFSARLGRTASEQARQESNPHQLRLERSALSG